MLYPELIPAIVIAFPLLYAAGMWHLCRLQKIAIPFSFYRLFAAALALQGLMYVVFQFAQIDIAVRGFWVRVSFIDLALCFSVPLTILYVKSTRVRAL